MIAIASSDGEIAACYDVMAQLRPHIAGKDFVAKVRDLERRFGFQLVFLRERETIRAVAGFRIAEWLGGGKYLEIEDLIVDEGSRSQGYGGELFDWVVKLANDEKCDHVKLVSHVRREAAHRFYLRKGMIPEAHYFSMQIPG